MYFWHYKLSIFLSQGIIQQIVPDMGGRSSRVPDVFDTVFFVNVFLTFKAQFSFFLHWEIVQQVVFNMMEVLSEMLHQCHI